MQGVKFEVEVRFYAYRKTMKYEDGVRSDAYKDNKQMELYKRYFCIEADDAKHAVMAVHNILSVMEFHNFEIMDVKEI